MTDASMLSLDDFISHWAADRPDAVVLEQDGRRTTFAGLEGLSRRIVAALAEAGVGKGDRIAWYGKNSDFYFQLLFSAGRAGIVTVPVGWRLAPAEVEYILRDTGAKLVFAGEEFVDAARAVRRSAPGQAARDRRRRGARSGSRPPRLPISPRRAGRRGDPALHLGHHRQSQGRGAERAQPVRAAHAGCRGRAAVGGLGRRTRRSWSACPARISAAPGWA